MTGFVPPAWNELLSAHRTAQLAHAVIRDPAAPQADRDAAVQTFTHAMDRVFAAMNQLVETGDGGRITLLLGRKDRR